MSIDKNDWNQLIKHAIEESLEAKRKLLGNLSSLHEMAAKFVDTIQRGGTIFFFGNGGSAADSQHLAAELVGRVSENRKGLPAIALTVDTSNLTAIANDFGYESVFARQIEALFKKGDLAVAISTSGNSPNVLAAAKKAKELGGFVIGFTGGSGGKLKDLTDLCFIAPASSPSRIQEVHILVGHILCQITEQAFCGADGAAKAVK